MLDLARPRRMLDLLRGGDWLDRRRVRAYSLILLGLEVAMLLFLAAGMYGLIVPLKATPTTDFDSFYAAGTLAAGAEPALAYDLAAHRLAEQRIYGDGAIDYNFFFYPPVLLLLCAPLASLPYLAAYAVWVLGQAALYLTSLRAILGRGASLLPYLAFPAAPIAFAIGQNSLLTAALFGFATVALERRRPFLAGLAFGCLCYKPHFGLLIPVALVAGGHWRAVVGAAVAVAGLALLTSVAFGVEIWPAYLHSFAATAQTTFEGGRIPASGLISPFAAALLLGAPLPLAYGVQGVATLAAASMVAWLWRRCPPMAPRAVALIAGTMVAVPVILIYDFLPAAICLAWLAVDARRTGWLAWEKAFIVVTFAVALLSRSLATAAGIPLGPVVALGLLALAWRRGRLA